MIDFIVLSLAVWRVSSLCANESGPVSIFAKIRDRAGVEVDEYGKHGTSVLSNLIICVWCLSFWIGLVLGLCYYINPGGTVIVALPFALSSGAVLVEETLDRLMRI